MLYSYLQVTLFSRFGPPSAERDEALVPIANILGDVVGTLISEIKIYGTAEAADSLQEILDG
jgi:hypothetical protein